MDCPDLKEVYQKLCIPLIANLRIDIFSTRYYDNFDSEDYQFIYNKSFDCVWKNREIQK